MTTLVPGKISRSRTPTLTVDNPLAAGRWRFRLTVIDNDKNESAPVELIVTVREPRVVPPVHGPILGPVLDPVRERVRIPVSPVLPIRPIRPIR